MEIDFQNLMLSKSDGELQQYIDDRLKYIPVAVDSAIAELQKRGRTFSVEELLKIREEVTLAQKMRDEESKPFVLNNQWKKNVVKDENAPEYYSVGSIFVFALIFGVITGAILLAINCAKSETKKGLGLVIAFGISFTVAQIWFTSMIPEMKFLTYALSMGGAYILKGYFWERYIGKDTKYKAKPIWIPLIIAIAISALLLWAIINNPTN